MYPKNLNARNAINGKARKVFPWAELQSLLLSLGYEKQEMSGSRVRFYHPENEIKGGALKAVKDHFEQEGWL
ncbi:type II toxin-antitoxin system HicA family toxin [Alteromonas sp. a30]|uniref:type II toxin-antitoxin system HicA family toxin n=1 Tax=Alteromonas sp. a30 TaxID=2730917 RepID=UPI002281BF8C|nr:type II toxin-antitoxin system HicA family toxin [Alteromonas sp. a30]MCY7297358.1 type II toxin-antitoxin system HicA family toxin [Alteromonas sp. a30]